MAIALYPGAFKPPHRGHFELVKSLLNNSAKGTAYTLDTYKEAGLKALERTNKDYDRVTKVVIFIGGAERNGLKQSHAEKVWQVYAKHLPGNVEIIAGGMNPMLEAKDYASSRPDDKFYAITGIRDESDLVDLKRLSTFKKLDNVEGLIVSDSSEGPSVRATNFRNAILSGNLDQVSDFFPKELSRKEILDILKMLKDSIIAEIMNQKIENIFTDMFTTEKKAIKEASSAPPVRHNSILKSSDRAKLVTLYNRIQNQVGTEGIDIQFNQDHIRISIANDATPRSFDYTPYMASILEYMIDEGMKITPLPEVKIRQDLAESQDFFGKTAYYDPNNKEVILYVQGRHPKDVMRSFTHEMIHHIQNLEGRLSNIRTQNTNEDDYLKEIEKEAYLMGNITFRNWEDKVKNQPKEQISENITKSDLNAIETYADNLFAKLGIDIEFTKHFLDRANDERNKKPISVAELIGMFKRLYKKHGKPLSKVDSDFDAVVKDFNSNINIPFAIDVTRDGIDMYAKTVMRKKDFKTSTPVYSLQEGKYDKFVNQLSRIAFEAFKDAYERGDKRSEFEFIIGHPDEEPDIESMKFEFDFMGVVEFTEDTYAVDGGANAGFDDDGEEIQPMLAVNFKIPKNPDWQQVSFDIKDVVRHELEHLTQDGANVRPGKQLPDDEYLRKMIDSDLLSKAEYFKLKKEIDAMIHGLYFKAKKSKQPFAKVVNAYLDLQPIDAKERAIILKLWRDRLPALGIKQEL